MTLLPQELHIIITAITLFLAFYFFIREKFPPHLVAMSAMVILLVSGVITTNQALSVFSNSAPITIACMFIISAALQNTGVIDAMGHYSLKLAQKSRFLAIFVLFFVVLFASAFINNTPVVVIMTPIFIAVAQKLKDYPSKYLIPLSYVSILGGTCTLIGTSTNILVDGVATLHGLKPFSMFETSAAGLIIALVGLIFTATIGRKLLPERHLLEKENIEDKSRIYMSQIFISQNSPFIGKTINEIKLNDKANYEIIDLILDKRTNEQTKNSNFFGKLFEIFEDEKKQNQVISAFRNIKLNVNDCLIVKANKNELLEIKNSSEINFVKQPNNRQNKIIVEAVVSQNCPFVSRILSELELKNNYDCDVIAIHRDKENLATHFSQIEIHYGDVLLIEGVEAEIDRLFANEKLLNVSQFKSKKFNKKKAPIAILSMIGVITLAALNVMPIAGLAITAAMLVIVTGCIKANKAYEAIEWRILMLIFGMLTLSIAMESTGLAKIVVQNAASIFDDFGPLVVLAIIFLITSFLTEIMSNNAAAVLLTPIAIGLANSLGVDPRPFVVAVMFAASASFATPIGYQTNTYVYNVGNYRFKEFLKIGIPMNIIILIAAVIVIPIFWKF